MKARLLDRFTNRIRLEGTLTTVTGLHIGAGESGRMLASDSPVVRSASGRPYIPGSSLKGVLRSAFESMLREAKGDQRPAPGDGSQLWTCDPVSKGGAPCVDHEDVKRMTEELEDQCREKLERERQKAAQETGERPAPVTRREIRVDPRELGQSVWDESCSVCRLFGSSAMGSRVRFPDLPLIGPTPFSELRNGVGIDREKELAAAQVLYDFEALPPDTRFGLTVLIDNHEPAEVGTLLYLFGQMNFGHVALGGKTSRGLGYVRVNWERIVTTDLLADNPFAEMLAEEDRLAGRDDPQPAAKAPDSRSLPQQGDQELWGLLADEVEALDVIDKDSLRLRCMDAGLKMADLNERLELGFEGKRVRKAWEAVLKKFAESGLLTGSKGAYRLVRTQCDQDEAREAQRIPELTAVEREYIEAAAVWWQGGQ